LAAAFSKLLAFWFSRQASSRTARLIVASAVSRAASIGVVLPSVGLYQRTRRKTIRPLEVKTLRC
jgi:hypothetical protein